MNDGKKECGDKLYENGKAVAICTQQRFTEHSHHDHTASGAIAAGLAKPKVRKLLIIDVGDSK